MTAKGPGQAAVYSDARRLREAGWVEQRDMLSELGIVLRDG
jgi:hypothetical protein